MNFIALQIGLHRLSPIGACQVSLCPSIDILPPPCLQAKPPADGPPSDCACLRARLARVPPIRPVQRRRVAKAAIRYRAKPRYLLTDGPPGRRLRPLPCPILGQTVPRFGTGQDCRCSYASLPAGLETLNALRRRLYTPSSAVMEWLGRGARTRHLFCLPALRRPGHGPIPLYVCSCGCNGPGFREKAGLVPLLRLGRVELLVQARTSRRKQCEAKGLNQSMTRIKVHASILLKISLQ